MLDIIFQREKTFSPPPPSFFVPDSLWQSPITLFGCESHPPSTILLLPLVLMFTKLNASCSACKVDWFLSLLFLLFLFLMPAVSNSPRSVSDINSSQILHPLPSSAPCFGPDWIEVMTHKNNNRERLVGGETLGGKISIPDQKTRISGI